MTPPPLCFFRFFWREYLRFDAYFLYFWGFGFDARLFWFARLIKAFSFTAIVSWDFRSADFVFSCVVADLLVKRLMLFYYLDVVAVVYSAVLCCFGPFFGDDFSSFNRSGTSSYSEEFWFFVAVVLLCPSLWLDF